ncbi:DUF4168 domain-containing protein [Aliihoeflea aestuarii]|uniref:DUF4168 domain-containing protein n=1 Tax=Aliihoeflea aestuarii TaxID=453840 RepID=UPI002093423D|nr:DUF4168 domain-containing protein [Aliihoeflea aestuarii]MCO6390410.1 DUF4168 domain-containing protein [Aliihoeflea aestuarii]
MAFNKTIRNAILSAALGVSAMALTPALAQETMEAPVEAPAGATYDEGKLQSFVVAFLQVDEINRTYAPQLQEAESEEAQGTVREEASQEMMQAVESVEGITVEEYGQIIQQAQTDPALAEQINGYIQQAVGAPAAPAEPAPVE